jgi:hypothetical protein
VVGTCHDRAVDLDAVDHETLDMTERRWTRRRPSSATAKNDSSRAAEVPSPTVKIAIQIVGPTAG